MAHINAEAPQHDTAAEPRRVLLVDDQPEVRRVVRRHLCKAGFVVVEAWNGRVAVDLARETAFDLVISDVRMPDMSGLELLKALHEHDPDLPVVLTSGSPESLSSFESKELGAFAYLAKPVPFDIMCDTAHRAVEERRARAACREGFEPLVSLERLRVARPNDEDDG